MIKYTRSYTRPSIDIPWWFEVTLVVPRSEFRARMAVYRHTGKVIFENTAISPDGLTFTWTGIWVSEIAFNEYDTDSILNTYWTVKDEYNLSVGIIKGSLEFSTV